MMRSYDRRSISRRGAIALGLSGLAIAVQPGIARAAQAPMGGTLRVGMGATGPSEPIDPVTGFSSQTLPFIQFDRLTWMSADQRVVPELATSWESNPALSRWTFHLRTDVKFHDGKPLTSNDVVRTFQRMLHPKLASQAYRIFSLVLDSDGIRAQDDHTVVFNCKAPCWNLPALVSDSHVSIVPADSPMDEYITKPIGTGAFMFAEYSPGNYLYTTRNPNYWRKGYPTLDGIRVFNVADVAQRAAGLVSNQFDLIIDLSAVAVESLKTNPQYKISSIRSGNCMNFNMAADQKPFDDNRVRTALKLACDRQGLVNVVWLGEATVGNDQPISPASRLHTNLPAPPYNVARAKELLAQAGYPNGIDLTLTTGPIAVGAVEQAVAYKQQAAAAGIRINVSQVPASGYYYNVDAGKWNFFVEPWTMRPDDALFFIEYAPRGTTIPPTHWTPPQYLRMLNTAREAAGTKDRLAKFAALSKFVAEEGPSVSPVYTNNIDAHSIKVLNYEPNPVAFYRTYWNLGLRG
ncbi:MAG: ABC transporter substrate-binding protein [Vulcanimicrobiaceae bacterium]